MSAVTDTDSGMEPPDFDRWGSDAGGPPAEGLARTRRVGDLSLARVAVLAVIVAALVALIVHFAGGGGRAASKVSGPTTHSGVAAAINVRLADLTAFHLGSSAGVSVGRSPYTAVAQCLGSSTSPAVAAAPSFQSPDFVSGTGLQFVSLSSTVAFAPASVLASEAGLAASSSFAACVANALAALTYRAHGLAITSAR